MIEEIRLRGRVFTHDDLLVIKECVDIYFEKGRTEISRKICEKLDWRQPNGWLKDRACRDVMLKLEELNIIELPLPLIKRKKRSSNSQFQSKNLQILADIDTTTPINDYPHKLQLEFAKSNKNEQIWNALVEKYHYLGHKVIVGRCIKYIVKADNQIVDAIAFSSPAWRIGSRDRLLKELEIAENEIHDVVINNSRFLILPNVQVYNLASTRLMDRQKRTYMT